MSTTEKLDEKKLSAEVIAKVLEALNTSANAFAKKLNVTPGSIYHIINGLNVLSNQMIEKIIHAYPSVSYNFLKHMEGDVLLNDYEKRNQMNLFNIREDKSESVDLTALGLDVKLDTMIFHLQKNNELLAINNDLLKKVAEGLKNEKE